MTTAFQERADMRAYLVRELRSGRFVQGVRQLGNCTDDGESFCCQGVGGLICNVPNRWERHYLDAPMPGQALLFDFSAVEPHNSRADKNMWSGWDKAWAKETFGFSDDFSDELMRMNDDNISFALIADYIEGAVYRL